MKNQQHKQKDRVPTPLQRQDFDADDVSKRNYEVKYISVDLINVEGQLVRTEMDSDHIIELSNSIAANGLLEPIVVRESGQGYQLIAGAHRLSACKRINWKEIPAHILPADNISPVKSLALIENIIRRDLSLDEECQALITLQNEQGLSTSQICDLLGKSRLWVQQRLAAPNMPDDVKEPLFSGDISMKIAEMICEVEDESIRKQITNQVMLQKLRSHHVRQIVDLYKEAPTIHEAVEKGIQAAKEIYLAPAPTTTCGACGRTRTYKVLKPIFICVDEKDCMDHVHAEVQNAG